MILNEKYVLHIPLFRHRDGCLEELEIDELLDGLIENLDCESFYTSRVVSYYKSRCFDEMLITVFTNDDGVAKVFGEWFRANNHVLGQEAFSYEHNHVLVIEKLR